MALEGRHVVVSKELFDNLMMIKEYEYYGPGRRKVWRGVRGGLERLRFFGGGVGFEKEIRDMMSLEQGWVTGMTPLRVKRLAQKK